MACTNAHASSNGGAQFESKQGQVGRTRGFRRRRDNGSKKKGANSNPLPSAPPPSFPSPLPAELRRPLRLVAFSLFIRVSCSSPTLPAPPLSLSLSLSLSLALVSGAPSSLRFFPRSSYFA